ncbi:hypothetical protein B0F90DRAFT_1308269 [Multifurca ochricompacta]|uniref:Uncharacterized protein n=1 Tax=Multifurca ochricompacta TaxID=376703 RepID=A0AAD4M6Y5_9AGAM|nr:hypothetical protein B0F90DRAFT_1308269 [Multifurca ochricompacta]
MNGVIISEDENEEALKPARAKAAYKAKAKATSTDPQAEEDLRAMMDIDDDQVTKVSRAASTSEPGTSPPATDMEVEDREPEPETAPVPTTRKPPRKPKKVIPVGRNGLKKRRVVRSRMTTDEKGYLGALHASPCRVQTQPPRHAPRSDGRLFIVRICG